MFFKDSKYVSLLLFLFLYLHGIDLNAAPTTLISAQVEVQSDSIPTENDTLQIGDDSFNHQLFIFPNIDFEKPQFLIVILVIVIIFSIISMLIILVFVLLNRGWMYKRIKQESELKEQYQTILLHYLDSETDDVEAMREIQKIANSPITLVILINEIIDLSINLKSEKAKKLRTLYFDLDLHKHSLKKLTNRAWEVRIRGYRECAFMEIIEAKPKIEKALHSRNEIVRSEAQIALVRLNKEDPYAFLDNLQRPFSTWEQNAIHETILYHNLSIPNFERWLNVKNKSVVNFSMKMIQLFKQENSWEKLSDFLENEDEKTRSIAIKSLGAMQINAAQEKLKKTFQTESIHNKILIIKALSSYKSENNIAFFKSIIENETDVWIQVEAARGIRNIGKKGNKELIQLLEQENYNNYQIIIKHVLDKRL